MTDTCVCDTRCTPYPTLARNCPLAIAALDAEGKWAEHNEKNNEQKQPANHYHLHLSSNVVLGGLEQIYIDKQPSVTIFCKFQPDS